MFAVGKKICFTMGLIKSISGIRGTIGGRPGETLSPLDVVKFTAAYGTWVLQNRPGNKKIIIGRDGRISGEMIQRLVVSTLNALGLDVVDLGLSTTPTVEMAVLFHKAAGGIILTASHNPKEWNALKLLNSDGEFISAADGTKILDLASSDNYTFAPVDGINSTGAIAVPALLKALGVKDITILNEEVNGKFAHNPEPLPQHLNDLCTEVNKQQAHLGIAVDPDVDRLCFVCEDGSLFGEEYTLVAVADYILQHHKGNTVSNMSSTRALKDITLRNGGEYFPSPVGEVNVVHKMKEVQAVIGGEGNGGIIVPDLHYGRDALIGIALFLTYLAQSKKSTTQLRRQYPDYFISKNKIELDKSIDVKKIFGNIQKKY